MDKYRQGDGTVVLHISAPDNRFDQDDLVKLGCKLHHDLGEEPNLFIRIFDSKIAAKRYVAPSDMHKPPKWEFYAKSFRAFYYWKKGSTHWIVWGFDPLTETSKQEASGHKTVEFCLN